MAVAKASKSVSRRALRFDSIAQCQQEIDKLCDAAVQGKLQSSGNWTAGQIFAHLAAWIEYGYQGYPINQPPLPIRWLLRMFLPRMLKKGMSPGVRIPGVKEGTVGQDMQETLAAAERLKQAFARLANHEPAPYDSPAFGPMSHEDRIRLNLRHAELHLGFLYY
jgi:hypothetical protein